jgi:predicted esterase
VRLYLASNGSPTLWINGSQVIRSERSPHKHQRWQHSAWVDLQAGDNQVLARIDNRRGFWGLQVEWYADDASHDAAMDKIRWHWDLSRWQVDGDELTMRIDVSPKPLDVAIPLAGSIQLDDDSTLTFSGQVGSDIPVALVRSDEPSAGFGDLHVRSDGGPVPLKPWKRPVVLGAIDERTARASAAITRLAPSFLELEAWGPIYGDVLRWVHSWLAQDHDPIETADIGNLMAVEDLVAGLEEGRNMLAEFPTVSYPAEVQLGDRVWQYYVQLGAPVDEPQAALLSLHGAGGTDRPVNYRGNSFRNPPKTAQHPPYFRFAPRATSPSRWAPDGLDALLDHLLTTYPIDEDRVTLTGFSMGGFGTWAWAAASPHRFAAIAPTAGGGDPRQAPRLIHLPAWVVHGDEDSGVPPYLSERAVSALQAAGGQVRYTKVSGAGHSFGKQFDGQQVTAWLLVQRRTSADRMPAISIPDVDDQGLGSSERVERQPRRLLVIQADGSLDDGFSLRRSSAVRVLTNLARRTGHLVDADVELHVSTDAIDDGVYELALPVRALPPMDDQAVFVREDPVQAVLRFPIVVPEDGIENLILAARQRAQGEGIVVGTAAVIRLTWYDWAERRWRGELDLPLAP